MATNSTASPAPEPLTAGFFRLAEQAMQHGDLASAERFCAAVLELDPGHADASSFAIQRALAARDPARALDIARMGLSCKPTAQLHFLHGRALEALGERKEARDAFILAHELDERMFLALFCQGAQEEVLGMGNAHIRTYHRALAIARQAGALTPDARMPPGARRRIAHAIDVMHDARKAAIEEVLAPIRSQYGNEAIARIDQAVGRLLGETEIAWPHPLQRPTFMLIPGLEPRPWFEREEFPFLADIERHTADIRQELLAVLTDESSLTPYVDMPLDAPAAPVWRELNHSTRWSSYHLFRHGERIEAHCRRCPRTVAALDSIPLMRVPDHSPEALFSILKAGTHIPSHTGVVNGRLTVHLPLVVPPDCGALKAGDEARGWEEGRCLVFDDSFAHEAWNSSNQDRAVLIFDIWDPRLGIAEREAKAAAIAAIGRFNRTYFDDDPTQEKH